MRGYATELAQWWTFLEQRDEVGKWRDVGVPAVTGFLSWLRNGRTVEHSLVPPEQEFLRWRRADRFLPNDWCLLPSLQSCDKGNACLTCSVFATDTTHRTVLERQLDTQPP